MDGYEPRPGRCPFDFSYRHQIRVLNVRQIESSRLDLACDMHYSFWTQGLLPGTLFSAGATRVSVSISFFHQLCMLYPPTFIQPSCDCRVESYRVRLKRA